MSAGIISPSGFALWKHLPCSTMSFLRGGLWLLCSPLSLPPLIHAWHIVDAREILSFCWSHLTTADTCVYYRKELVQLGSPGPTYRKTEVKACPLDVQRSSDESFPGRNAMRKSPGAALRYPVGLWLCQVLRKGDSWPSPIGLCHLEAVQASIKHGGGKGDGAIVWPCVCLIKYLDILCGLPGLHPHQGPCPELTVHNLLVRGPQWGLAPFLRHRTHAQLLPTSS